MQQIFLISFWIAHWFWYISYTCTMHIFSLIHIQGLIIFDMFDIKTTVQIATINIKVEWIQSYFLLSVDI